MINVEESLLLKAYRGERAERAPVWLMRQAGRFLPEYQQLRERFTLLELFRTPALAAQVTLQPLERFELDAGIIFADILTPLIGLGFELEFAEGTGPRFSRPLEPEALPGLRVPEIESSVGYTLEAISIASQTLRVRGIPLIGFCGAPFTLSSYLIEGSSPARGMHKTKRFMIEHADAWHGLQQILTDLLSEYLIAQARAGANALQIFDSWLGNLGPADYREFVEPYLRELIARVRVAVDVPMVFFSTETSALLPALSSLNADCIGVDWRVSLKDAERLIGLPVPIQGNLDPIVLCSSRERVIREVRRVLEEGKTLKAPHIFNVGHGVIPETSLDNVSLLVKLVRGEL